MLKVLAELKSLDAFVAGDAVVVALQEPGKLPLCEQEIDPALVGKRDVSPEICDNEVKSVTFVKSWSANYEKRTHNTFSVQESRHVDGDSDYR